MSAEEERKEIRAQRHDFIKEYYRMATVDLDRHLKAGWQTIAVLAGGAAILAAGHDGKIGMPVATVIALISAFWGALTVIDANYWSLRAIGFLANVEAIYFSKEDRRFFNPYIGNHPPYKLLNSLRYMFWLCVSFGAATALSMLWEITRTYPTPHLVWARITTIESLRFLLWSLPLLVISWGILWICMAWRKRLRDYINFSKGSPGPGMRLMTTALRHVTLESISGEAKLAIESDVQGTMLASLEGKNETLNRLAWVPWITALLPTAVIALIVIVKM